MYIRSVVLDVGRLGILTGTVTVEQEGLKKLNLPVLTR